MPVLPEFKASNFTPGQPIDNPYFPLLAGQIRAYRAEAEDDGETVVETHDTFVTHEAIDIQGVQATIIRDTEYENGRLKEDTLDYYAQDHAGNVWYLGEDVVNYRYDDDGNWIGTDDAGSFRQGLDGAQGGYKMLAEPGFGNGYYQEFLPGEAIDEGIVVAINQEVEIGLGEFEDAIQILDTIALEPDVAEFKFYAPGIGEVLVQEDLDEEGEPELEVELTDLRLAERDDVDDEGDESFVDPDELADNDEDVGDEDEDDEDEDDIQLGDIANRFPVGNIGDAEEPELDDMIGNGEELVVTFIGEGAGFDNALGAYTVDLETGALGEGQIVFAVTEDLRGGQSVGIQVDEGEALGLFLVPDAGELGVDLEEFEDGGLFFNNIATGENATIDDSLAPLITNEDGIAMPIIGLHALGNDDGLNFLNPAAGVNAIELEYVLIEDSDDDLFETTIIGFEDLLVTDVRADFDFNDVVVTVSDAPLGGNLVDNLVAELNANTLTA